MTIDDMLAHAAIRTTLSRCAQAGDSLRAEDYAACFTEAGTLSTEIAGRGPGLAISGRAAIFAWQNEKRAPGKGMGTPGAPALTLARHNLTTCQIDITSPGSASVRTYWFVLTNAGPDHSGVYRDSFERVGDEWLIAERRVRTEWAAEYSLMVPPGYRP